MAGRIWTGRDLAYGLIAHSNEHYGSWWSTTGSMAWCRRNQGPRNRGSPDI
jgi:hypothetical protein